MPYKPKRPCAHPGCPALTYTRFCETHTKQDTQHYDKFRRNPAAKKRYGNNWRRIRAAFIQENPLCELCWQEGKAEPATTVHHRKELSDGGGHERTNLQSLCASHHSSIHMHRKNNKKSQGVGE